MRAVIALNPDARDLALTGGDDYEVLCTVPSGKADSFRAAAAAAQVDVTETGEISEGEGARFIDANGQTLSFSKPSFSHF